MDKKLLITLLALTAIQIQASAVVTTDEALSEQFMRNTGYSQQTVEMVSVSNARGLGQEYYTVDEKKLQNSNGFVKFWRKLYAYFDPGAEDYSFYHHDTKTTPSYTDL